MLELFAGIGGMRCALKLAELPYQAKVDGWMPLLLAATWGRSIDSYDSYKSYNPVTLTLQQEGVTL